MGDRQPPTTPKSRSWSWRGFRCLFPQHERLAVIARRPHETSTADRVIDAEARQGCPLVAGASLRGKARIWIQQRGRSGNTRPANTPYPSTAFRSSIPDRPRCPPRGNPAATTRSSCMATRQPGIRRVLAERWPPPDRDERHRVGCHRPDQSTHPVARADQPKAARRARRAAR